MFTPVRQAEVLDLPIDDEVDSTSTRLIIHCRGSGTFITYSTLHELQQAAASSELLDPANCFQTMLASGVAFMPISNSITVKIQIEAYLIGYIR